MRPFCENRRVATETIGFDARPSVGRSVAEAVVFSSLLAAAVGASLVAVTERALYQRNSLVPTLIVVCGTLVIYNIDRLRDRHRDLHSAPRRTAFVDRHAAILVALVIAAAAASVGLLIRHGVASALTFAPILGLGLFHRRLKRWPSVKAIYVALAWTAAALLAARLVPDASADVDRLVPVAAILGFSVLANTAVAGSEAAGGRRLAFFAAATALALSFATDRAPAALAILPLGPLVALLVTDGGEWGRLTGFDGALGLSALISLAFMT
ncbi:MAG: hypothetical protein HKP27_02765 [Myxococcales bacterium]|nr:hypothetical protein [Myxococcales bacterium]